MDNINFSSNWIPAWQQTDSYSAQPWCLLSKNVDIFSSSKSIRATAWSDPVSWDDWIIAEDWGLELRTDWKIYDWDEAILDPAAWFISYPISYDWEDWQYAAAQFWTPQSMSVYNDADWLNSLTVFTDRSIYNYSRLPFIVWKKERKKSKWKDWLAKCAEAQNFWNKRGYLFAKPADANIL